MAPFSLIVEKLHWHFKIWLGPTRSGKNEYVQLNTQSLLIDPIIDLRHKRPEVLITTSPGKSHNEIKQIDQPK